MLANGNAGVAARFMVSEGESSTADVAQAAAVAAVQDTAVVKMIEGIAAGDSAALAAFYDEWFDRTFDLARRLTRRDEAFCLDVVQDVMMKVIAKLRPGLGITSRLSMELWFVRVVHTTAIDLLRREFRRHRRELGADARRGGVQDAHSSAAEVAQRRERLEWLTAEMSRMEREDASLVAMRFGSGRPLSSAGDEFGMTVGAAHGRLRRLLERVRRVGKERFDEQ